MRSVRLSARFYVLLRRIVPVVFFVHHTVALAPVNIP
jgi:hypothetical protein